MKCIVINILFLLVITCPVKAQQASTRNSVFQAREELRYKVKWSFFRVGTIIVRTERDSSSSDPSLYKLVMIVESNPNLFFLSKIHEYNESQVNAMSVMSKIFRAKH